ncbi:hypothetical protein AGMMS4952_17780 [Spirochaetia bacterium]|nr:hypothetical protein AGMMS4952_17780 [Spirochaetia bacterium]
MFSPISRELPGDVEEIVSSVEVVSLTDPPHRGRYLGVWDTGAMLSIITPKIFSELGLTQTGKTFARGVLGKGEWIPTTFITIILEDKIRIEDIRVAVSEIPESDMLIGFDVIKKGDFSIKNLGKNILFTFTYSASLP